MQELNDVQQQAVDKILALRTLTRTTGTVTARAQSAVLRTLVNDDLIAVAEYLQTLKIGTSNQGGAQ